MLVLRYDVLCFKKVFEWPQAVLAQSETEQCSKYKLGG